MNPFSKPDPDELCLFWDEIEAVFARQIEHGSKYEERIPTLKEARKALYKAAKQAAKGKPLKTLEHIVDPQESWE